MGVGARLVPVMQLLSSWGFSCRMADDAAGGFSALQQAAAHLLLVELEPSGGLGVEITKLARAESLAGAVLLVDEPQRSQQLVAALARGGFDGFIPLPADPNLLLRLVENALLAQLASVQSTVVAELEASMARNHEQVAAIDASLHQERSKTIALQMEVASLRGQLDTMHMVAGKANRSTEGSATMSTEGVVVDVPTSRLVTDLHRTITRSTTEMPLMEQATLNGVDLAALLAEDDDDRHEKDFGDDPPTSPAMMLSDEARALLRGHGGADATVRMPVRPAFAKDLWEQATQMTPAPVAINTDEVDFVDED
jgi:DNA-binding response OmpR family regulator